MPLYIGTYVRNQYQIPTPNTVVIRLPIDSGHIYYFLLHSIFVQFAIFIFYCTLLISNVLYICAFCNFYLFICYFYLFLLRHITDSQLEMTGLVNMMSCLSTIWIVMLYGTYIVPQNQTLKWYLPKDHPCLDKKNLKSNICTGFTITW